MFQAPWLNARILTTLLFVFLSGAVLGAITMRLGFAPERHRTVPYWKEGGRELSIQKFKSELNLDSNQTAQIETVLDDFMMYHQMLQAQMDDVRATGKERIRKILSADQRQKFERMMSELQSHQIR